MAFWRWATMDSWDPFSLRFWCWGNLFGQSDYERIEILKDEKFSELLKQVELSHPEQDASQIFCPLTNKPISEPVISIEGMVYEKNAILRRIAAFNDVPGSHRQLIKSDIYEFNALVGVLQFAQLRRKHYQTKVQLCLESTRQAILQKKMSVKYPSIFLCQLSNRRIKSAMITPQGRVYDAEAIKGYFEKTGNDFDPIDGSPLCLSSLMPFYQFEEYARMYRNLAVESADKVTQTLDKALDTFVTAIECAHVFFQPKPLIKDNGKLIPKPGMDYHLPLF